MSHEKIFPSYAKASEAAKQLNADGRSRPLRVQRVTGSDGKTWFLPELDHNRAAGMVAQVLYGFRVTSRDAEDAFLDSLSPEQIRQLREQMLAERTNPDHEPKS